MSNAGRKFGRSYSYASKDNQWKAFERLPRSVRDALNGAARPWSPYPIWRRWEAGQYKDAKALVKQIRTWDRRAIAKAEKERK